LDFATPGWDGTGKLAIAAGLFPFVSTFNQRIGEAAVELPHRG
jgi:hypothetical protein